LADDNETHSVSKESSSTDKPCSTDSNENKAKSPIDERKSLKRNLEANTASIQDVDNLHPIKRARSAYFIFQSEKRGQIKAENAGASIGSIAKIIGKLWSELSSENKKRYQEEAAKEKEEVAKAKARRKEAGLLENNSIQKGSEANDVSFPIARIKKICRLDPEVKGLSKEAVHLITKAAEEFTMKLGKDTFAIAQMNSRKTILPDDVADVCSLREPFLFLNEDIRDLVKKLSKEAKVKRKEAGPSIIDNSTVGVKPLTSYFGAK
jgi:histone H3/H4